MNNASRLERKKFTAQVELFAYCASADSGCRIQVRRLAVNPRNSVFYDVTVWSLSVVCVGPERKSIHFDGPIHQNIS